MFAKLKDFLDLFANINEEQIVHEMEKLQTKFQLHLYTNVMLIVLREI